jgi:poly(3-hydroxybutyrate) depolymerase
VLAAAAAAGADALHMLADMLRDHAGGDWRALHSPLMEYEELLLERAGKTGGLRASGFVRLAWTDDIDGSTQFCRAYLPANYPANKGPAKSSWPALIFLHGYNPPNPPYVRWWSITDRHNGVADRNGLIVLEPMARGNVDYRWMGERDVLRCLEEAGRRFQVDRDRVYLSGESMGGNGTWLIASRNPQLFAAAAPVFGGWDYRINVNGYAYTNPQATRPMERCAGGACLVRRRRRPAQCAAVCAAGDQTGRASRAVASRRKPAAALGLRRALSRDPRSRPRGPQGAQRNRRLAAGASPQCRAARGATAFV